MRGNALSHYIRYLFGFDNATTQTSLKEQEIMRYFTSTAKSIVEIGVFEGYNTREFALHSPDSCRIWAIDPCYKGSFGFSYGKAIALHEWKKSKVTDKITLMEDLSWNVVNSIPNSLDFIFVDGDHSFEGVKNDFDLYSKKLSVNGVIALHDARLFDGGWTKPDWGPVRLMEEYIKPSGEWQVVKEVDSLVILKRKN